MLAGQTALMKNREIPSLTDTSVEIKRYPDHDSCSLRHLTWVITNMTQKHYLPPAIDVSSSAIWLYPASQQTFIYMLFLEVVKSFNTTGDPQTDRPLLVNRWLLIKATNWYQEEEPLNYQQPLLNALLTTIPTGSSHATMSPWKKSSATWLFA